MSPPLPPVSHLLRMSEPSNRDSNSESSGASTSPPHTPGSMGSGGSGSSPRPAPLRQPSPRPFDGVTRTVAEAKTLSESLRDTHLEAHREARREGRRAPPPPRLPLGPPPLSSEPATSGTSTTMGSAAPSGAVPLTRNPSDGRRNINSLLNEPQSASSASQSTPTTQYFSPDRPPRSSPTYAAHPRPQLRHDPYRPPHHPASPPLRFTRPELRHRSSYAGPPSGPMTPTSATLREHQHPHPPPHPQQHGNSMAPHPYPPAYQQEPPAHHYPPAYQQEPPLHPQEPHPYHHEMEMRDRRYSYHAGPITEPGAKHHQVHQGLHGLPAPPLYHPEMAPFPGDGMRTPISRTTKACDSCRSRKVRCSPEPTPGACTRCREGGRECVYTSTQKKRGPAPGKSARNSTARLRGGSNETYRERRDTWSSSSAPQYSPREHQAVPPGPYSAPAHMEAWPWAPGAQPPPGFPRGAHDAPLSAPPAHYYPPTPYDPRDRPAEPHGHREHPPHDPRGETRSDRHHPYPRPSRSAGPDAHEHERRPSVSGWGGQRVRTGATTPVYAPAPLSAPVHPVGHYPAHHGPAPPPPQAHVPHPQAGHGLAPPPPQAHAPHPHQPDYPPHHNGQPFDPQYTMRPHPASGWPRRDHRHEQYRRGERSPSPRDRRERRD